MTFRVVKSSKTTKGAGKAKRATVARSGRAATISKIRKMGNSLGATFPKAMLDRQGLADGSGILITETPNGILISPDDSDFAEAMAAYEVVAEQYKNALRELAK